MISLLEGYCTDWNAWPLSISVLTTPFALSLGQPTTMRCVPWLLGFMIHLWKQLEDLLSLS